MWKIENFALNRLLVLGKSMKIHQNRVLTHVSGLRHAGPGARVAHWRAFSKFYIHIYIYIYRNMYTYICITVEKKERFLRTRKCVCAHTCAHVCARVCACWECLFNLCIAWSSSCMRVAFLARRLFRFYGKHMCVRCVYIHIIFDAILNCLSCSTNFPGGHLVDGLQPARSFASFLLYKRIPSARAL